MDMLGLDEELFYDLDWDGFYNSIGDVELYQGGTTYQPVAGEGLMNLDGTENLYWHEASDPPNLDFDLDTDFVWYEASDPPNSDFNIDDDIPIYNCPTEPDYYPGSAVVTSLFVHIVYLDVDEEMDFDLDEILYYEQLYENFRQPTYSERGDRVLYEGLTEGIDTTYDPPHMYDENIDEEYYDGIDNDGDMFVDEDVVTDSPTYPLIIEFPQEDTNDMIIDAVITEDIIAWMINDFDAGENKIKYILWNRDFDNDGIKDIFQAGSHIYSIDYTDDSIDLPMAASGPYLIWPDYGLSEPRIMKAVFQSSVVIPHDPISGAIENPEPQISKIAELPFSQGAYTLCDMDRTKATWYNTYSSEIEIFDLTTGILETISSTPHQLAVDGNKIIWFTEDSGTDYINFRHLTREITQEEYDTTSGISWLASSNGVTVFTEEGVLKRFAGGFSVEIGGTEVWNHQGVFVGPDTIPDFSDRINDFISEYVGSGDISIPIIFRSFDFPVGYSPVLDINLFNADRDFKSYILANDTDLDSIIDGGEYFQSFGRDIIEIEDAVEAKEWRNPLIDQNIDGDPGYSDYMIDVSEMFFQTKAVLTSSFDHVDKEGVRDSWLRLIYTPEESGRFVINLNPDFKEPRGLGYTKTEFTSRRYVGEL